MEAGESGCETAGRVLVIDDAPEIRSLFRTVLRLDHPEVEVTEAESGEAALEILIDLRPDAVIVDSVMGGMDGIELVHHLRDRCPASRIVMFSSLPYGEVADLARAEGADAFVEKTQGYESALAALGFS